MCGLQVDVFIQFCPPRHVSAASRVRERAKGLACVVSALAAMKVRPHRAALRPVCVQHNSQHVCLPLNSD